MSIQQRRNHGFTLISTLFLLVIVGMLGSYMVNLTMAQQHTAALDMQISRAQYLASSGMDWAVYELTNNPGVCPSLPSGFQLEGFDLSVTQCSKTDFTEGVTTYSAYDIEITASMNAFGDPDYVSRAVRAVVEE